MDPERREDIDSIGGVVDGDGNSVPGRRPIENPAGANRKHDEEILEPHPDEPGVKSNGESEPTENPGAGR